MIAKYPEIHIVRNTEYAETNNMYSAWLGREAMGGEDFLMMNADVFFDASVIAALLSCPAADAIVTDIGSYFDESMKVREESGRLSCISKTIPRSEALGASIDVYKLSGQGGAAFFSKCKEYIIAQGERGLWSEATLNDILPEIEFNTKI